MNYIIPQFQLSSFAAESVDSTTVELLKNLTRFDKEMPGFIESLKSCPFVRNQSGELRCANQLYDPDVKILLKLLPSSQFPMQSLHSDLSMLLSLRLLGLKSNIDCDGVIIAARSIESDPASVAEISKSKSEALIKLLEANIDRLLEGQDVEERKVYINDWVRELRSIMWISVHVELPAKCFDSGLPWSPRT